MRPWKWMAVDSGSWLCRTTDTLSPGSTLIVGAGPGGVLDGHVVGGGTHVHQLQVSAGGDGHRRRLELELAEVDGGRGRGGDSGPSPAARLGVVDGPGAESDGDEGGEEGHAGDHHGEGHQVVGTNGAARRRRTPEVVPAVVL